MAEHYSYASPAPPLNGAGRSSSASDFAQLDDDEAPSPTRAKLPPLTALDSGAWAVQGRDGRRYHSTSLLCLRPADLPRRLCIKLVESPIFEPIVLIVIIMTVVTMAWNSPLDPDGTPKAAVIEVRQRLSSGQQHTVGRFTCTRTSARART